MPPASQRARRERILDAAVELAAEGGYDAVQMREVAERADVALGTLYRYFPSKVHLLVSAMGRTFLALQDSVAGQRRRDQHAGGPGLPGGRRGHPLSRPQPPAVRRDDPGADDRRRRRRPGGRRGQRPDGRVHHLRPATSPGSTPTERDALVAHIIGKVWLTDVLTLLSRRMTVSAVLDDLEATIALVMSRAAE